MHVLLCYHEDIKTIISYSFLIAADITFVSGSNQQQSLVPTVSLSALLLVAIAGLIILT